MIFADLFFIYIFLPVFALCYAISRCVDSAVNRSRKGSHFKTEHIEHCLAQNIVLVIFSLIFYAWGEPVYIALMLCSIAVNYMMGLLIDRGMYKSKAALIIGVILNIAAIGVFKYSGLIVGTLNSFGLSLPVPQIGLPIGISFYTFQSISYLADVYRGKARAQGNLLNLALYISLFPQLIAGPIVRYTTIDREITKRSITLGDIADGSFRFLVGLGKKVILANQLSEISGQLLDSDAAALSAGGAWLGIIAFALQIYFDFSGYSDMAIGIGRCLGFHFDENFEYPYICCTITEFWRRWHISLGSFFRDYVYIPLGGNKKHQPLNIMVVWFLTGLWHGASWNFALWGVYFGVIIMLEKYTILKVRDKIPSVFLHIYSLFLILFGWAIFYFEDFDKLGTFIGSMFGMGSGGAWDIIAQNALTGHLWLLIVSVICCLPVGKIIGAIYDESMKRSASGGFTAAMSLGKIAASAGLLAVSTLLLIGSSSNPFLYLRF